MASAHGQDLALGSDQRIALLNEFVVWGDLERVARVMNVDRGLGADHIHEKSLRKAFEAGNDLMLELIATKAGENSSVGEQAANRTEQLQKNPPKQKRNWEDPTLPYARGTIEPREKDRELWENIPTSAFTYSTFKWALNQLLLTDDSDTLQLWLSLGLPLSVFETEYLEHVNLAGCVQIAQVLKEHGVDLPQRLFPECDRNFWQQVTLEAPATIEQATSFYKERQLLKAKVTMDRVWEEEEPSLQIALLRTGITLRAIEDLVLSRKGGAKDPRDLLLADPFDRKGRLYAEYSAACMIDDALTVLRDLHETTVNIKRESLTSSEKQEGLAEFRFYQRSFGQMFFLMSAVDRVTYFSEELQECRRLLTEVVDQLEVILDIPERWEFMGQGSHQVRLRNTLQTFRAEYSCYLATDAEDFYENYLLKGLEGNLGFPEADAVGIRFEVMNGLVKSNKIANAFHKRGGFPMVHHRKAWRQFLEYVEEQPDSDDWARVMQYRVAGSVFTRELNDRTLTSRRLLEISRLMRDAYRNPKRVLPLRPASVSSFLFSAVDRAPARISDLERGFSENGFDVPFEFQNDKYLPLWIQATQAPMDEADFRTLFRITTYPGTRKEILTALEARLNDPMTPRRARALQERITKNQAEVQAWEDTVSQWLDSSTASTESRQAWPQRGSFVFDPLPLKSSVQSDTLFESASIRGPAMSDGKLYFGIRMAENFLFGFYRFDPETGVTVKVGELDSRKTGYRAAYAVAEHYLIFDVEKGILNLDTTTGQWTSHPTVFFRSMTDSQICTDYDRTIYFVHPVKDNPLRAKITAYDVINGTTRDIIAFSEEAFGSENRSISNLHLLLFKDRYVCMDLAGDFRQAIAYDLIAKEWVAIGDRRDELSGMVPGLSSSNPTIQEVKEWRSAQRPRYFISEDGTEWRLPKTLLAPDGSQQLPFAYQFLFDARRSKDERVAYATMTDASTDQLRQKAKKSPLILRSQWSFKEGILFNASPPYFGYWISSDEIDTLFEGSEPHVN